MSRIVELKWECGECDTAGILGRNKNCPSCGSPREKGEMSMSGLGASSYGRDGRNKAATVTDPELLKMALAGPDWFCSHCGTGNKGDGDRCNGMGNDGCGAPRYNTAEEDHPAFTTTPPRYSSDGWDPELDAIAEEAAPPLVRRKSEYQAPVALWQDDF